MSLSDGRESSMLLFSSASPLKNSRGEEGGERKGRREGKREEGGREGGREREGEGGKKKL